MTNRKGYGKYDESQRAEIGKQAKKNGIRPTAKMLNISKSTVNSILVEYNKTLNEVSKSSSEKHQLWKVCLNEKGEVLPFFQKILTLKLYR